MPRQTLAQRVADAIARQIAEGALQEGNKLPSLREYMRLHGYAKNTVITAYEHLASQGLVEARHGKGFFVCKNLKARKEDDEPEPYTRALDTIWMMRQQFVRDPGHSHLGEGFPPIEWLMDMRLDKFHRQVVRGGVSTLFRYGTRLGNPDLRQRLVQKLADYQIAVSPRQLVTTLGANHAMDLIIRRYVAPGDTVLVEDPGYYPLFGKLQLQGARMLGIAREADGPDLDTLERQLKKHRPKLFFLQSVGHNPTGSDLSPAKAHQLLQLAEAHDLLLVENDAMADFKPSSAIKLTALDQSERTLYLGSFSKSISAALRVGFIAGSKKRIEELADLKMLLHNSGAEYSERTIDVILAEGHFLRHLSRLQERLRAATQRGLAVLDGLGAEVFCRPEQSLYLWARFPGADDANTLTRQCLSQGVMLAPGSIFAVDRQMPVAWTRLNVAYLDDPAFRRSLMHLGLAG
ncbi:DNA-binding transcriptional regulator, MocR family, contains an aminotransferase domain [Pseudomonas sp. NFACC19-2]|jgi:DNA-binding transcriptional MocR family regulator|uniref:Transcriptional regulator, GntR family n=3 Tax=Pseudomonadaceae TaxID=135621 RepID=A0A1H2LDC2_9PSED|nr:MULTISPECIES: PLP-dependent aminotransferase family protein [Pseudomonas]KJU79098.1 GntR family transcriptional regulator [Pseudomonas oleovorans]KQO37744.1 GntR family transcriptional regulator [Pseudomonas sp. Leaf83]MBG0846828.1 PLP-dependent aminotransferase family protein [Pseudomonas chengduensis]MBP3060496.1 aminotransferase class I/II-fold pyridoxal phosphate-dependent enzyme [Pseudomonas chengduensis]MDH0959926.1 PLP-dependent aminotransferase family protein [Pseudomonas chengduens